MLLTFDDNTSYDMACHTRDRASSLTRFALSYAADLPTASCSLVRELAAAQAEWHLAAVWTLVWLLSPTEPSQ
jgi:hypothetical protein